MKKFVSIAMLFVAVCALGCSNEPKKQTTVTPTSTSITNTTGGK